MKQTKVTSRIIALILVVVLAVSLLSGVTLNLTAANASTPPTEVVAK